MFLSLEPIDYYNLQYSMINDELINSVPPTYNVKTLSNDGLYQNNDVEHQFMSESGGKQ